MEELRPEDEWLGEFWVGCQGHVKVDEDFPDDGDVVAAVAPGLGWELEVKLVFDRPSFVEIALPKFCFLDDGAVLVAPAFCPPLEADGGTAGIDVFVGDELNTAVDAAAGFGALEAAFGRAAFNGDVAI